MTVTAFKQANQLLREGKLEEAVVVYRQAIEQNPQFYVAYQNLGETLGKLGQLNEAVEMYRQAIELKPSAGWLHQELGLLLERLGKKQQDAHLKQQLDKDFAEDKHDSLLSKQVRQKNQNLIKNKTFSIHIAIPSFNRNTLLQHLLKSIDQESTGLDISVSIFDDGSSESVSINCSDYSNLVDIAVHRYNNHGKTKYWELVNRIFSYLARQKCDFFIYLPDDIELIPGFFEKAISSWQAIDDDKKIVLNLALDHRTQCWTGFERIKCQFGEVKVFKTQWVDMLMLFDRSFLEALDYRIKPISLSRWNQKPNLSSGVGQQISQRLHGLGFSLYQISEYLISHGDHESMMNPEERKINPIIVKFTDKQNAQQKNNLVQKGLNRNLNNEKVVASLASIPDRIKSLEITVNSLYPQVDLLNVYLNDYQQVPEFLNKERIQVAQSQIHSDLGDSGKFWWCEDVNGYHFICDDDITYPDDYVETMVHKIEQYHKKAIVGLHGTIYRQPFFLYHKSRNVLHCLQDNEKDTFVQMVATSSLAYHSSTIKVLRSDFEHVNMADVWFSLLAQKHHVPRIIIEHRGTWLKHNDIDMQKTIYAKSAPDNLNYTLSTRQIQDYVVKKTQPWHIDYLPNKPTVVMSLMTFNSKKYIQGFIDSWEKRKSSKYHWILIIADNGSTDGTIEYLYSIKPFWQFTLIQKQGLSDPDLINAIFSECQNINFDYGFYSENDVLFVKTGWDELYINAIDKSGYAHLCYPNIDYVKKLAKSEQLSQSVLYDNEKIDVSGYCFATVDSMQYEGMTKFFTFNKEIIEKVGYADTSNFSECKGWQVDFSKRCCRAGFNDVNKYWDAKGSSEYLKIQEIGNGRERLVAEYSKFSKILLAKSKIIEDEQRIYVNQLIENNLSKSENYDINKYFDKVYLINWDSKIDRWHQATEWANQHGINLTRFVGVDGNIPEQKKAWEDYVQKGLVKLPDEIRPIETTEEFYFNYQYDVARVAYIEQKSGKKGIPTPEAWVHLLSVIHVLEDAINKGYEKILVLDDDVVPHKSIKSLFPQGMREAPEDWKIILLGAFQNVWDEYITPYSEHLYQSNGTNRGSFAMALDSSVFVPLLHYSKKFDLSFDLGALHKVQFKHKDKCFIFKPNIFHKIY